MQETWVLSLGWEDPLEMEMATHSSTLAWKIPWTEEPSRLQSTGSQRVRQDWETSLSLVSIIKLKFHVYTLPDEIFKFIIICIFVSFLLTFCPINTLINFSFLFTFNSEYLHSQSLLKTWKKNCLIQIPIFPSISVLHLFKKSFTLFLKKLFSSLPPCFAFPDDRIKVSDSRTLFFLISFSNENEQANWNIREFSEFPTNLISLPVDDILTYSFPSLETSRGNFHLLSFLNFIIMTACGPWKHTVSPWLGSSQLCSLSPVT